MSHAKKLGLRFKAIPRGMLGIASTRLCPSLRVRHLLLFCPVGVGVCVRKPQGSCCHFGSLAASFRQSLDEVGEDLLSKTGGGTPLASYWEPRSLQINPSKDTPPKGHVSNRVGVGLPTWLSLWSPKKKMISGQPPFSTRTRSSVGVHQSPLYRVLPQFSRVQRRPRKPKWAQCKCTNPFDEMTVAVVSGLRFTQMGPRSECGQEDVRLGCRPIDMLFLLVGLKETKRKATILKGAVNTPMFTCTTK